MNIKTIFQILSPAHDASNQYKADMGKGLPPYLDQVFLGSVVKLLAQLAVVGLGISISPDLQNLIVNNLVLVIPAVITLYGAVYKLYGMLHAKKALEVTVAQVAVNTVKADIALDGQAACVANTASMTKEAS